MPFYDYRCNCCDVVVGEMRPIPQRSLVVSCTKCVDGQMHRVISGASVIKIGDSLWKASTALQSLVGPSGKGPGLNSKNKDSILCTSHHSH